MVSKSIAKKRFYFMVMQVQGFAADLKKLHWTYSQPRQFPTGNILPFARGDFLFRSYRGNSSLIWFLWRQGTAHSSCVVRFGLSATVNTLESVAFLG